MKAWKKWLGMFLSVMMSLPVWSQARLSGNLVDKSTQKPIAGATVTANPGNVSTAADNAGRFQLTVKPGDYQLIVTAVGYVTVERFNVPLTVGNETVLTIEMEEKKTDLSGVVVSGSRRTARAASLETPLSVQRLTTEEIKANPGGNFDISKVIQSLPGVGGGAAGGGFRNDIIIRGGGPSENVYYLDGIEVPVINHFQTQGSSGGPQGMLNVSFIEDVKLSTSAFDARYDNTTASVFQFKQKNGNPNRLQGNVRLSASEVAGTFDGPLSKDGKHTFLASARRSYLQLLFSALDLPIRPNYWDFQFKTTHQLTPKLTLTTLGIGAIDEFKFAVPKESTPEKIYSINSNPSVNQWNYTVGVALKKLVNNGYWNLALSRNSFDNRLDRFENNDNPVESERTLKLTSRETENKLRWDMNQTIKGWKIAYGAVAQWVDYNTNTFQVVRKEVQDQQGNIVQPEVTVNYATSDNFLRYGAFAQAGKRLFDERIGVNFGLRTDMNSFTTDGNNPLSTLSPRLSLSYALTDKWNISASSGVYYRLPAYLMLGFRDNSGKFVNQDARYLRSTHYTLGTEFLPRSSTRITLEGFYKNYGNVPVSIRDGISLANLGGDFNVLGNEPVSFDGKGETYGVEFFLQQKLTKRFFGIFSYTWFSSKFSGTDGKLVSSAWDNGHLLSATMGYKLPRNWELGLKFRFQGGAPYTPFDMPQSQLNFLSLGTGIPDYALLNTLRLRSFNAGDIRIDKKWYFKRATLDLFLDITNFYGAETFGYPQYTFRRTSDNSGFLTTDGQAIRPDGSNGIPTILPNNETNILPTIGFIVEF